MTRSFGHLPPKSTALLENFLKFSAEMMRQLWDQIELILSREVNIEAIWIPSHCGIQKNDVADELARRGILESNLLTQHAIPLTMEAARSIIKPTVQTQHSERSDTSG